MDEVWYALSIKQPWAALILAGRKTIEIRTWPTKRRGRVLLHTGKVPEKKPEAWAWVDTPELRLQAEFRGGIVGVMELNDCRHYVDPAKFAEDRPLHLNEPDWFVPPKMYGFCLANPRPVRFFPYKGNTVFFTVEGFQLS